MPDVRVGSLHRPPGFVVQPARVHELAPPIDRRGEDARRDLAQFDCCEPEFHVSEPRNVGRRMMQRGAGMRRRPHRHGFRLMRRQVVGDEADRLPPWIVRGQLCLESEELCAREPRGCCTMRANRGRVEGSKYG